MVAESAIGAGIWVCEVTDGKEAWERYTAVFINSGEAATFDYLHHTRKAHVFARCHPKGWTVWVQGQGDEDAMLVDWLSVECYGQSLAGASAIAAGLLEGIAREEIEYALSTERQGVAAP